MCLRHDPGPSPISTTRRLLFSYYAKLKFLLDDRSQIAKSSVCLLFPASVTSWYKSALRGLHPLGTSEIMLEGVWSGGSKEGSQSLGKETYAGWYLHLEHLRSSSILSKALQIMLVFVQSPTLAYRKTTRVYQNSCSIDKEHGAIWVAVVRVRANHLELRFWQIVHTLAMKSETWIRAADTIVDNPLDRPMRKLARLMGQVFDKPPSGLPGSQSSSP
ncbi:hypothetical protein BKA70DRAFT_1242542 [Coprinopsis sp. MPI-PUGE-AT-0042]|nr:hypothetical protein BKA70DRAFT_1242542 [Coprinopsis sp. MPI-PUGE-AT-0042]